MSRYKHSVVSRTLASIKKRISCCNALKQFIHISYIFHILVKDISDFNIFLKAFETSSESSQTFTLMWHINYRV